MSTDISPPTRAVSSARTRTRLAVHIALLVCFAGALVALDYRYISVDIHVVIGLAFVALVVAHVLQRRHTVARLASRLARVPPLVDKVMRQAASDAMLMVITANVLLSGLWDWRHGSTPVMVPLPPPLNTWHKLSSIVLLFAILVHLWRRRRRFRRSVIR